MTILDVTSNLRDPLSPAALFCLRDLPNRLCQVRRRIEAIALPSDRFRHLLKIVREFGAAHPEWHVFEIEKLWSIAIGFAQAFQQVRRNFFHVTGMWTEQNHQVGSIGLSLLCS